MSSKITVVLDNIRSAENVGSIIRTADGFGVDRIILVGITPGLVDRFGRENQKVIKASLGAERTVLIEKIESAEEAIVRLKKEGMVIVSLEQSERSIDYRELVVPQKIALIVGNEVRGVSSSFLESSDYVIEIPMKGKKESLNVAVATGVALSKMVV